MQFFAYLDMAAISRFLFDFLESFNSIKSESYQRYFFNNPWMKPNRFAKDCGLN